MTTKDYSSLQENTIAKYLGFKTVVGSGARNFHYGDVISMDWLGECKTHIKKQDKITFFQKHWNKLINESIFHHRNPVLIVDDGTQQIDNTYCLFRYKFDSIDNLELVPMEYSGKNITFKISNFNCNQVYVVTGFDKVSTVYICKVDKFKEFLEEG